ncbi:MAG: TetR/AcrR family transcriptional regulator [Eggerthellaceae bacterium]|nr:TetR/AcrR family transcriptional regulator [Eggerthellaceae bacterium]
MPRPRKDDPQSAAPAKIEAAFWQLLEKVGYPEITVRRISQESGTNRNSFYYHYDGLEDLARKAFVNNAEIARPLILSLIAGLQGGVAQQLQLNEEVVVHAQRVMLCARSESPFLRRLVNELLRDTWFEELGVDAGRLSPEESMQVEFIFGGLVAVLGGPEVEESPLIMPALANSDMGRVAVKTLKGIAEAQADRIR